MLVGDLKFLDGNLDGRLGIGRDDDAKLFCPVSFDVGNTPIAQLLTHVVNMGL